MRTLRSIPLLLLLLATSLQMSAAAPFTSDAERQMKFQYFFLEALNQKMKGNLSAAVDLLDRCHTIDPTNPDVYAEFGKINTQIGQMGMAHALLKKAVELDKNNNTDYKLTLARLLIIADKPAEAAKLYEEIIEANNSSDNSTNYYYLACLYAETEEYGKAINTWHKLEEIIGFNDKITLEIFKLYIAQGKKKKAFAEIDRLIKAYPKSTEYRVLKADLLISVYGAKNGVKMAEKYYQESFRLFPQNPELTLHHGLLQIQFGLLDEEIIKGIDEIATIIDNPNANFSDKKKVLSLLTNDSISYYVRPDRDSLCQSVIRQHPDEEDAYFIYAAYLSSKKDPKSLTMLQKGLSINPTQDIDTWIKLINIYLEREDWPNTIEACEEALLHFPESAEVYYTLGETQMKMRKTIGNAERKAIGNWEKALEIAINQKNDMLASVIAGTIGDTYFSLNEKEMAFEKYEKALELNDKNYLALNNYAYYLSLVNQDLKKAEKMSGITVSANPKSPVFLDTYAWIFFKQGEYGMALLYIEQAYNNGGKIDSDVLEHYGDILYKMNEPKEKYQEKWRESLERYKEKTEYDEADYNRVKHKAETGEYVE